MMKAAEIFELYKDLTEAERYFTSEEIAESKAKFEADLESGNKEHYIAFAKEQIEEIKPTRLHGAYDFGLIREYEALINKIENF